ncbi:TRAP transporter small permease subunit [Pusillimonas sp. ANT_WB101]|uniref:TRAP transporter small permease subunit n=1 Tax=Pusillimonas sp. ANT_WB101 TaxID=2597356 RepID=UPI00165DE90D|nr:TRAP transporter small permease [Pusillimonas sp. ANT_WB101]
MRRGIFGRLVDISGISVGVATFLIGLLVAYDVIARSLFRMTNSWISEVTVYLMGYIAFMGAAYALREGAHVSVDMLVQKLSARPRAIVVAIADLCMVLIISTLTWLSFGFFLEAWASNEVSDTIFSIKLWIPYLSFFVGMAWLLLVLIVQIAGKFCHCENDKDIA